MTSDENESTSVRTYVPKYQKEIWAEHADELGMSQSEFVKTMVQAGRKGFNPPDKDSQTASTQAEAAEPTSPGSDPRSKALEDRVVEILSDGGHYDWDDLITALTKDTKDQLEEVLQDMQSRGEIRYSGRDEGYVLTD